MANLAIFKPPELYKTPRTLHRPPSHRPSELSPAPSLTEQLSPSPSSLIDQVNYPSPPHLQARSEKKLYFWADILYI